MIKKISQGLLFLLLFNALAFSNTRVAFSRPSSIVRMPGLSHTDLTNQYIVGFGGEILGFSSFNYCPAVYFHGLNVGGFDLGLSYNTHAARAIDTSPVESNFGIHVGKTVFNRDNMIVNVGVHDIVYQANATHRLSLFATFSQFFNLNPQYNLSYNVGFGTGYLSYDSHDYEEPNTGSPASFFVSTQVKVPVLEPLGGLKVLAEFGYMYGWGLNVATQIPLNQFWTMNVGMTNFQNIHKLNDWDSDGTIFPGAPAIALGFQMRIPSPDYNAIKDPVGQWGQSQYSNQQVHSDSLINKANMIIGALEDSLRIKDVEYQTLNNLNQSLQYKVNVLADSINGMTLTNKILQQKLNEAMKHLSQSLEFYYSGNYLEALNQVDKALEIYPDLAISYARKGSIYYKMEDINKATINWNIALQLDPEFGAVRDILLSIKNNKENKKLPE